MRCREGEGLVVAHEVVVVLREAEHVRVHQHPRVVGVEGGEHLAHRRYSDLLLMKKHPSLSQEEAVGHGGVGVPLGVVVQADDVTLGDQVQERGGKEGEEANDAAEGHLQGQALHSEAGLKEDLRHETETGSTCAI